MWGWLGREDSNLQPLVPKISALAIELLPCRRAQAATCNASTHSMHRLRLATDVSPTAAQTMLYSNSGESTLVARLPR